MLGWHVAVLLITYGAGFAATVALVPSTINYLLRIGIVDSPSDRHPHLQDTPRGGGVALIIGFFLACLLFWTLDTGDTGAEPTSFPWSLRLFFASIIAFATGFIDDYRGLSPRAKIAGQVLTATVLFLLDIKIRSVFGITLDAYTSFVLTAFWVVLLMNTFNLVDGLDGLATGLAAIASLGILGSLIFRDAFGSAGIMAGFIGACGGFLIFNRSPAKVFLGDSGSNFLGLVIAATTIESGSKGPGFACVFVPLIALSLPILDTFLACWRRLSRYVAARLMGVGEPCGLMKGDLHHLHHRLVTLGMQPKDVVSVLYLAEATLVLGGLLTLPYEFSVQVCVVALAAGVALYLLSRISLIELWYTSLGLVCMFERPENRRSARFLFCALDGLSLAVAFFLATRTIHQDFPLGVFGADRLTPIFTLFFVPWSILIVGELSASAFQGPLHAQLSSLFRRLIAGASCSVLLQLLLSDLSAATIICKSTVFFMLAWAGSCMVRELPALAYRRMQGRREQAAESGWLVHEGLRFAATAPASVTSEVKPAETVENSIQVPGAGPFLQ